MQSLIIILTLFAPFSTVTQDENTIEKKMKEILKSMQSAEKALHGSTQENSKVKSDLNTAKKHEKDVIKKLNQLIKSIIEKDFENDSDTTIPVPDDFRDEKEGGIPRFGENLVEKPNDFQDGSIPTFGENQGEKPNDFQEGSIPNFGENQAEKPFDFVEGTVPAFGSNPSQNPTNGHGSQYGSGPQNPATNPYLPERTDPPSVFKDELSRAKRWGDLPSRTLESIDRSRSMIDDMPPKWRDKLKEYFKSFK